MSLMECSTTGDVNIETSVFKLRPVVDTPGFKCFGIDDNSPVAHGHTLLSDFNPKDVATRNWVVPRLASVWRPRKVINSLPSQVNDYPCVGLRVPTFSARALDALRDLLEPNGEILPLESDTGQYYAYNVTTVADVLDRQASQVNWPHIYKLRKQEPVIAQDITHYVFFADRVKPLAIFRIPEDVVGYYVTDQFAQRVREHDLRGFDLRKVWPVPPPYRGSFAEMERRASCEGTRLEQHDQSTRQ